MCGLIADYNAAELLPGPDRLGLLAYTLLTKRIKIQGFRTAPASATAHSSPR